MTYPGKRGDDIVAKAGVAKISGFTMTLGPLSGADNGFGGQAMCSAVTLLNRDTETQDYSDFDFAIQGPDGNVKGELLAYTGDIGTGQLVHDGKTSGRVCFKDTGQHGVYIISWEPDHPLSDRRAVWLFKL